MNMSRSQRSIFNYLDLTVDLVELTPFLSPLVFFSASQRSARRLTCIENPAGEGVESLRVGTRTGAMREPLALL